MDWVAELKDETLAHRNNDILLSSPGIHVASVTPTTAQTAAELRSRFNLKTPDAIQLATAVRHEATALLTNDRDFGLLIVDVRLEEPSQAVEVAVDMNVAHTCH